MVASKGGNRNHTTERELLFGWISTGDLTGHGGDRQPLVRKTVKKGSPSSMDGPQSKTGRRKFPHFEELTKNAIAKQNKKQKNIQSKS
jgi:hypothetical protein